MNEERFRRFMEAVDDELLEEAQKPINKRHGSGMRGYIALAACFCVVVGLAAWKLRPFSANDRGDIIGGADRPTSIYLGHNAGDTQPASSPPVYGEDRSAPEVEYAFTLPENASNVSYNVDEVNYASPLISASFTLDGSDYVCSMMKSEQPSDISNSGNKWQNTLAWNSEGIDFLLQNTEETACLNWYSSEDQTQWCLTGGDVSSLLETAEGIVQSIGYNVAVAPAEATDLDYSVLNLNGLLVGESAFRLGDVNCAYRMAATGEIKEVFDDISGTGEDYDVYAEGKVEYCPARIYYNEGGAGKIVWFDVVPGLLYSYSMDSCASEEALIVTAAELFTPAQGNVG